jgi:hypothetical protein
MFFGKTNFSCRKSSACLDLACMKHAGYDNQGAWEPISDDQRSQICRYRPRCFSRTDGRRWVIGGSGRETIRLFQRLTLISPFIASRGGRKGFHRPVFSPCLAFIVPVYLSFPALFPPAYPLRTTSSDLTLRPFLPPSLLCSLPCARHCAIPTGMN